MPNKAKLHFYCAVLLLTIAFLLSCAETTTNRDDRSDAGTSSSVAEDQQHAQNSNDSEISTVDDANAEQNAQYLDAGGVQNPDTADDAAMPDADTSNDAAMTAPDTTNDAGGQTVSVSDPQLPAIVGDCPEFAVGSSVVEVDGLDGINLIVGEQKQRTGSLLFYWHGTSPSSWALEKLMVTNVIREVTAEGGIVVAFTGSTGTGGDCSGTSTFSVDDFNIADKIVACAVRDHGIDPRRIYSTGCSAGGLHSGCMALERSSYLAAAAPNSGGILVDSDALAGISLGNFFVPTLQDPNHVPSIMSMHGGGGTKNDVVGVNFAVTSERLNAKINRAGGFAVNCMHTGGHCGADAELYDAAWAFLKAHPFGVVPEPYQAELPDSFPTYCEIYESVP